MTEPEYAAVRTFVAVNGYTMADAIRLGVAALTVDVGGDPDDPPLIPGRWVRDELALLRLRTSLARLTRPTTPLTPEERLEGIRRIVAGS